MLERLIFDHFEDLAVTDAPRLQSILAWHRYTLAGAALTHSRLRELLKQTYRFPHLTGATHV